MDSLILRETLASWGCQIDTFGTSFIVRKNKRCRIDVQHKIKVFCCLRDGTNDPISKANSTQSPSTFSGKVINNKFSRKVMLPPLQSDKDILLTHYIPVYVCLPVDVIKINNTFTNLELFNINFKALKAAHVDGLKVHIWWGIVESTGPGTYDWSAYQKLFKLIDSHGFKLKVAISFHSHERTTGQAYYVPLPAWVLNVGSKNSDIFFKCKNGLESHEYLSFGIDHEPVLEGRTALQVYVDFLKSFRVNFSPFFDNGMITEVEISLGPSGELRYPYTNHVDTVSSRTNVDFKCYNKFLIAQLQKCITAEKGNKWRSFNHSQCSYLHNVDHVSDARDHEQLFLTWYSQVLLSHGDSLLEASSDVFLGCMIKLTAKIAGVHCWFSPRVSRTDLEAGYFKFQGSGHKRVIQMLSRHAAIINVTLGNMQEHTYSRAFYNSSNGLDYVLEAGQSEGLDVAYENLFPTYDRRSFDFILERSRPEGINKDTPCLKRISSFTYSSLCHGLMLQKNWTEFIWFVRRMHAGLDYYGTSEDYFNPRAPLERSKLVTLHEASETLTAFVPLHHSLLPLFPKEKPELFFSRDAPGGGLGAQKMGGGFPIELHGRGELTQDLNWDQ